jgi:hypothetical protein
MRKSLALTTLALGATLALTACGSTTESVKAGETTSAGATPISAPSSAPVPKPTPTQDSKKSVRGNLLMEVGDTGLIQAGSTGKTTTKFTVNSIAPGTCNQKYSRAAENGQIVLVDIAVETTPELAQSSYPKYTLSGYDFKFIADNGTTFNGNLSTGATYSCIPDAEVFPSGGMGPAEKITAKVVLDVPAAHGILVIESGLSGGFEYKF